jgi:energy-coupling factor transporter ATP-binding protein EcfA2
MNFPKIFSKKTLMNFYRVFKSNFRRNFSQEANSGKENLKNLRKMLNDLQEYAKKNPKSFMSSIGGPIVGGVGLYYYYLSIQEIKSKKGEVDIRKHGANSILKPLEIDEELHYVERKEIEERLNQIIGNLNERKYAIIVGCKGSGKSTVLDHVVNGKKGIVVVRIDGKTTLENLDHKLLEASNVQIEPWNQSNFFQNLIHHLDKSAQVFGEICNSIKEKKDGKIIWVPTVIFEVEGRTSKEVIQELYKTAKQISSDKVQARCILVLSDANACLSMTSGF